MAGAHDRTGAVKTSPDALPISPHGIASAPDEATARSTVASLTDLITAYNRERYGDKHSSRPGLARKQLSRLVRYLKKVAQKS
ncbi:MAG TPA: hypothetical protein VKY19_06890 [Ktedonosporobacter sp.]|nr:hypothetical protein [Ktedonosporobacter sp.]